MNLIGNQEQLELDKNNMENKKEVEDINTDSDLNNINEEEGKIDNENENEKQKRNSLAYNNLGKI